MVSDWLPSEKFKYMSLEVGKEGIKEGFREKVEFELTLKDGLDLAEKGRLDISARIVE